MDAAQLARNLTANFDRVSRLFSDKTDEQLIEFGKHCLRIGAHPRSPCMNDIGLECVRRGLLLSETKA